MNQLRYRRIFTALLSGAILLSSSAFAQYVWLDEKGVKQYSDIPPPATVPLKRILKQPGSPAPTLSSAAPDTLSEATLPAPATKEKAPMTVAERNADFQKRRADQAAKEKKAAEEAQRAADKAKNCENARMYQRALQSGERVARTDKNGERYFLSDQERAKEVQEANRVLDQCK